MASQNSDLESQDQTSAFSEKSIRLGFIRKVYSLLAVELALTFGVMAILILVKDIRYYLIDHPETAPIAGGVFLLIVIFIACSQPCQRMFPVNLIAISSMALCEGVVLGAIAAYYSVDQILYAVGLCILLCLGFTLFSFQTKLDFNLLFGFMFVILFNAMIFGILAAITDSNILYNFYVTLGTLIYSMYLVIDTHIIFSGKYDISPEDYILATLILYIDMVRLLLFLILTRN